MSERAQVRSVPFCRPDITEAEVAEVVATLRSGWITTGPRVERFEKAFAAAVGAPWAVGVSSCTGALHLSLLASGVGPGDRVITTVNTFTATAAAILHAGAEPVLVDVEEGSFNMDPAQVERASSCRPKAILPVHIAGHPCEMDRIAAVAEAQGCVVIEDAAHALPAAYRGARIGAISPLTCFSFYATKNLTTGEGGMITGGDPSMADRLRLLGHHGMTKGGWQRYSGRGSWYYEIVEQGFKYNLTDIAAAIGLRQLERLESMQRRRVEIVEAYDRAFSALEPLLLPRAESHVDHAWHLYIVRLREGALRIDRAQFIRALTDRGIAASVHFIPLYHHPYYRKALRIRAEEYAVAERVYRSCLSLPLFSGMTDREVAAVIEAVTEVVKESTR
jgi:dTDP-4-amino-4,6-dideoxygalactose transaminase